MGDHLMIDEKQWKSLRVRSANKFNFNVLLLYQNLQLFNHTNVQ